MCCCEGGADDAAAGEPEVPVPFQEEVHHPQGKEETEDRLRPAVPLPHPHQRQCTVHQVDTTADVIYLQYFLLPPVMLTCCISLSEPSRSEQIPATSTQSFASFSKLVFFLHLKSLLFCGLVDCFNTSRTSCVTAPVSCRYRSRAPTTRASFTPGWAELPTPTRPNWPRRS